MSYNPDCADCPTPKECKEKNDCQVMRQIRHPRDLSGDEREPPERELPGEEP